MSAEPSRASASKISPWACPDAAIRTPILLDLVLQRFPVLTVTFLGLLGVPGVDLRVFNPRLHPLAHHERIETRRGAAKGATALKRQGLVRLLAMGRLVGSTFYGPHPGPNTHGGQVVYNPLTEAREGDIDRTIPSIEAVGVS